MPGAFLRLLFPEDESFRTEFEPARAFMPVWQHPSFAVALIQPEAMASRTMGVAMNQNSGLVVLQQALHLGLSQVRVGAGAELFSEFAAPANALCDPPTPAQWQMIQQPDRQRRADPAPIALVGVVIGAFRVAMNQHMALAAKLQHRGLADELASTGAREVGPEQEIAVADHDPDLHACAAQSGERIDNAQVERVADVVISDPELEQIAEDPEHFRLASRSRQEAHESSRARGSRGLQMKVGDEKNQAGSR